MGWSMEGVQGVVHGLGGQCFQLSLCGVQLTVGVRLTVGFPSSWNLGVRGGGDYVH